MKSKKIREGKFIHTQHTEKFYRELTNPNQNIQQPFRILDEKWIMGKFKGKTLKDTPTYYIKWVLGNFNHLSKSHKNILEKKLT